MPAGRTLPRERTQARHRWIARLLWVHVVVLPIVAVLYGNSVRHSLVEGLVVAGFALAASLPLSSGRTRAVIGALGLLTCSAVLVHVTGGLIEAHFHFFVMVTILSLYEDWLVFGVSIGFVAAHHAAAGALGAVVYAHPGGAEWKWALVHALFIACLSVANLVVWRASEDTRAELAQANEEVMRSNRDLEQFAYAASHDLSEPLRMVSSYLDLLDRRHGEALHEDGRRCMAFAVEGAAHMRRLIDDLLAFSRLPSETAPVSRRTDARAAVDSTLRALAHALEETGAEVEVAALPVVEADPVALSQVFQNLISNAVKFRDGDAPRVRVEAEHAPGEWVFTVTDNGIGIPPEHAERIFQMFQRLHTADEYEGTGMGLAICRKIVDRHGGRIWVEPNPERGARFSFSIPD